MNWKQAKLAKPKSDEIELSLFGPGYGESILCHIGDGKWVVVDSCSERGSSDPIALEYLSVLGFDGKSIDLVVASHWHDDHIRGLSQLVEATDGMFVCSAVINCEELPRMLAASEFKASEFGGSGVDELKGVFSTMRTRERRGMLQLAVSGLTVLERKLAGGVVVSITTLSPSNAAVLLAQDSFRRILPTPGQKCDTRIANPGRNKGSVALHVKVGRTSLLLGSDLEVYAANDLGWKHVVDKFRGGLERGHAYKVAHHGSSGADYSGTWNHLLHTDCVAVLSEFVKGGVKRPKPEDVERIRSAAGKAFITSMFSDRTKRAAQTKREKPVEKTLAESGVVIRLAKGEMGHVRLRCPAQCPEDLCIEMFGAAREL